MNENCFSLNLLKLKREVENNEIFLHSKVIPYHIKTKNVLKGTLFFKLIKNNCNNKRNSLIYLLNLTFHLKSYFFYAFLYYLGTFYDDFYVVSLL